MLYSHYQDLLLNITPNRNKYHLNHYFLFSLVVDPGNNLPVLCLCRFISYGYDRENVAILHMAS